MIWKMIDLEESFDGDIEEEIVDDSSVADLAIMGVYKVYAKLNSYNHIRDLNEREIIKENMPGFRFSTGWGLHLGWSVEGAIGSQWKIDPTYVSPAVNVAHKITMATPYYDVPVIISGDLYDILSPDFQAMMKIIDIVRVKGADGHMKIYTMDMEESNMQPEDDPYWGCAPTQTEGDERLEWEEKMAEKKEG